MKEYFYLLSLVAILAINPSLASDNIRTVSGNTTQCEATANSLRNARRQFRRQCGTSPRDCDPVSSGWRCSSSVIGANAPRLNPVSTAVTACTASGNTLRRARIAFTQHCTTRARDCDRIGRKWLCSSEQIGASSPPLTSASTPPSVDKDSPIVDGLSIVAQWNELALAGVRDTGARPTVTTWQLFMMSSAMYDALAAYTDHSTPYALSKSYRRPSSEHTLENKQAAVSQAAYQILRQLYSEYEQANGYYLQYLNSLGYQRKDSADNTPAGIGYRAAKAALLARSSDGSNYQNDFAPITSSHFPQPYTPVNSPDPISQVGIFGPDFDPNRWQPLRVPNGTVLDALEIAAVDNLNINSFGDQEFLTPHWGAVQPFALNSFGQFRPSPPPQFGSHAPYTDALGTLTTNEAAYRSQIDEVISFSASLDDRNKVIAEFWADGPRTESPPGHWNQLAHGMIERDSMSLDESIHLFFTLNGALLDAGIATWEAKRFYDYIRPASAIRWLNQGQMISAWGGPNLGTQLISGETWRPYQTITFVTPPFPEYVSGHSTFSRASAEVLTNIAGSGTFYDGVTTTIQDVNSDGSPDKFGEHIAVAGSFFIERGPVNDVVLQWPTFISAADEAGISRLFGGIHIQDGDLRGRELGRQVGIQAYQHAQSYIQGTID